MGETIHEGWLVKSPPDKRNQTLPRFFQAKWRRRYFVLHAPPASDRLPGSSNCVLDYFKDHTKGKKKGSIDLDQCEEITAALDSAHYQHLFALRSKHKGTNRTYYLAADSELDMTKWVECLCNVCGCKPVPNQDEDIPPAAGAPPQTDPSDWPMLPAPTPTGTPNRYYEGTPTRTQTVRVQPTSQMTPPPRASPSMRNVPRTRSPASHRYVENGSAQPVRQASVEEYFPIWDSETGESKSSPANRGLGTSPLDKVPPAPSRTVRRDSVDSIPDMDAPPPPVKQGSTPAKTGSVAIQGEFDPDQTYDHPSKSYHPAQYVNMDTMDSPPRGGTGALYQVPPPRPHQRMGVDDGVYKVPPARYTHHQQQGIRGVNVNSSATTDSWYQVPPPAKGTPVRQSHDMFYDVPPSRPTREHPQRNSNSSNESKSSQKGSDSAYGSEDFYDHPPTHRAPEPPVGEVTKQLRTTEIRSTAASVISQGDVYDIPPPRKAHTDDNILERVPPPPKPPKTTPSIALQEEQGPYLNLPPNSKSHPGQHTQPTTTNAPAKRTTVTMDDMYDFPSSVANKDRAMLSLSPPPPHACATTQHGYVNAPPGFVATANSHHTDSVYMPMDLGAQVEPSDHMIIQGDIYLPMGSDSRTSTGSAIYTDMTGSVPCPSQPPLTRSYSAAPGTQPPRLQRLTPQNSQDPPSDYPIHVFSSLRTRSFKRDPGTRPDIPLPMKRPGTTVEDSSSDEDDEDSDSVSSHERSLDNIVHRQSAPLTHAERLEKKSLNSTPPAPQRAGEVQYLDLDLEETAEETERSPVFARSPPAPGSASPTDYKEIDFIKTKALSDVRKDLDTKRKSSEKSLDD